ncbi:hypothetical protein ACJ73_02480 [Blastomyces percursus]|uniref:Uncharacterized protein n=1 Tax=Blastomyces percursus TaxID=1658174 RepID=A0A1J9RDR4_9EURO|nr:hypothetical protein ACJ73_02480 [Blastomyces percursus]
MNWMGGRLQRHSYKSHGSLKATQKQYFAKARLKAQKILYQEPSSSSARSSRPQNLSTTQLSHQQTRERIDSHEECERRVNQTIPSDRSSKRSLETGESQYFEELRQKLLKRQDWASLSIVRPLRTCTFPRRDQHTINIAKRQRCRPQKMRDRIAFQEDYVDADIALGEVIDLPRGYIDQNGLDVVLPGPPNMNRGDVYDEMRQSPSTIGSNSPSDLEYLRLEEGFETDLKATRMAHSRNIDPAERSSRAYVLWNTPDHREGPEVESSAVFGREGGSWLSSSNCHNRHPSIPARSMDIKHHNAGRDSPNEELPPDYWSVPGSESPTPSQDQSESMLLDIEEMDDFMSSGMDLRDNDIGPNVSSTSDPDISNNQPMLEFRSETSSIVSHSAMEQNMSASLELQDYPSSPYRYKSIQQHPSTQEEIHDREQYHPRQQKTLGADNVSRPEILVPTSRGINEVNVLANTDDGEDHLWKSFMVWPTSQEPSNHYTLLTPVRVEGSDLDATDGPAYPNSLTEHKNESNETISHVEGTEAMTVCDSADLSETGGSELMECEIPPQNAAFRTTHDSFVSAQHNNVSEFKGHLNETPISQEIDKDDASSDVQPAETEDIRTANHRLIWSNRRPALSDDGTDNILPRYLDFDSALSRETID